jgi:hypothetical protein
MNKAVGREAGSVNGRGSENGNVKECTYSRWNSDTCSGMKSGKCTVARKCTGTSVQPISQAMYNVRAYTVLYVCLLVNYSPLKV